MHIEVPYGEDTISVEIDERNMAGALTANDVSATNDSSAIMQAIENPVNSKSLNDFLSGGDEVLFIVNDATRPTPTPRILEVICDLIKKVDCRFLIATGAHRAPTQEEYHFIFGRFYQELSDRIFVHNARSAKDMAYITRSRNGTEIYLNRMVTSARKIVILTSVEPHYFAGYTGGRKSLLPGVAGYQTIEQNHRLAMIPAAKSLGLRGNPVHEDMEDLLVALAEKQIFCLNLVLDKDQRIYAALAGDIAGSFNEAVKLANRVFVVDIQEKAEIVVTVARNPMDIDLYQSQKAIEHGKLALKNNGILILVSKCRCGVGDQTFVDLLSSCATHTEVLEKIDREYKLGYHKAAKLAELRQWADIYGVTSLPDRLLRCALITPFPSLQAALDSALLIKGGDARVLFLLDGTVTVPRLAG